MRRYLGEEEPQTSKTGSEGASDFLAVSFFLMVTGGCGLRERER